MSTPHLGIPDTSATLPAGTGFEKPAGTEGGPNGSLRAGDEYVSRETVPHDLPKFGWTGVMVLTLALLLLLGGLFVLGYRPIQARHARATQTAAAAAHEIPVVSVVRPRRPSAGSDLKLPANVAAFQQTAVYPRANGYLRRILVDIGNRVEADQLLAELDTPELDAQLGQARASARQAEAGLEKTRVDLTLAESTLNRYDDAGRTGAVARQEMDERRTQVEQAQASMNVAQANLEAARAQIQQLEALRGFARITAPFAGVVTARNYDIGALLSPNNTTNARPLLQMEQIDTLRVYVNVPQAYATAVRVGQDALLEVSNYPGRDFRGKLARTAGSLDPATRTLRVEIHVPNNDGLLYAGMYGRVNLRLEANSMVWVIPASALVYNADGLSVATLDGDIVHFKTVEVGRDSGSELEVLEGLTGDETVIGNPGEHIHEGVRVRVAAVSQTQPRR